MFCFAPLAIYAAACSNDASGPHLPAFNDIPTAAPAIRTAARAVVRVRTAGESGTGAFVSSTGMLLTNNHILGAGTCPLEGCQIQLTFMHQRGEPSEQSMTVLALPTAVDVGLDMALVQIFASPGSPLTTPDFLTFVDHDAQSLLGQHVTVVGHPQGELKKWTDGVVIDAFGDWFTASAFTLPGSSGSPVLDDDGHLVGIIHRGPTGEDLITGNSVSVYSTGTASAPIEAAMQAPLPAAMISLTAPTTADAVLAHDVVYLNGHATTANVGGTPVSVLTLLGQACDAALARTDFASPDDLSAALKPCYDAFNWIECRLDASPGANGTVCPTGNDVTAWASRYQAVNNAWLAMNGSVDLYAISFGIAALAPSKSEGKASAAYSLSNALSAAGHILDFTVANYLAAFDVETYAGADTLAWLRGYASQPDWALYARSIASTFLWWNDGGRVSNDDALAVLQHLDADPNVTVGAKLYIEDSEYLRGK